MGRKSRLVGTKELCHTYAKRDKGTERLAERNCIKHHRATFASEKRGKEEPAHMGDGVPKVTVAAS